MDGLSWVVEGVAGFFSVVVLACLMVCECVFCSLACVLLDNVSF